MSLSLVSGPATLTPTNALETSDGILTTAGVGLWLEHGGLYVVAAGGAFATHLYAVQLDGGAVRVSGRRIYAGIGWDVRGSGRPAVSTTSTWQSCHLPSTHEFDAVHTTGLVSFGVMPDRLIRFNGSRIAFSADLDVFPGTTEYDFDDASVGTSMLAYAGEHEGHHAWWCINCTSGLIFKYDAVTKAEIGTRTGFGSAVRLAGYSRKHDVFFAIRRDTAPTPDVDQLYIYANEPQAATVADPVFGESPRRGARTTLTTTVLGDLDEPCAGRNVTFSVTAGTVDPETVATDVNGVATTTFQAPFTAGTGFTASAELAE